MRVGSGQSDEDWNKPSARSDEGRGPGCRRASVGGFGQTVTCWRGDSAPVWSKSGRLEPRGAPTCGARRLTAKGSSVDGRADLTRPVCWQGDSAPGVEQG
eukprot:4365239-Prymnesium_polylepis.1